MQTDRGFGAVDVEVVKISPQQSAMFGADAKKYKLEIEAVKEDAS